MLFTTDQGRKEFFARCRSEPESIRAGDALSHARTTELGVWSDVESLKIDVATVMLAEVRAKLQARGHSEDALTPEDIKAHPIFRRAFAAARAAS